MNSWQITILLAAVLICGWLGWRMPKTRVGPGGPGWPLVLVALIVAALANQSWIAYLGFACAGAYLLINEFK